MSEAIRIHIPDLHIERLDHLLAHLQLVFHVGLAAVDAILRAQQGDGFLGVGEGIAPSLEAGCTKTCHPLRIEPLLCLGGEENVAVEIDAVVARVDDGHRDAALFQIEGLIAQIGVEDVYPAGDQIVDVDRSGYRDELALVKPLIVEGGQQFGILMTRKHHDPFATHVRNGENAAVAACQEDGGRVLVDAGQCQQRLALGVVGQHLGVADAKVGASGQHLLNRTYSLATWPYLDIQTCVGVIPLGLGHVIAHKLGLMQPAQLQYHLLRQITCPFTGLEG